MKTYKQFIAEKPSKGMDSKETGKEDNDKTSGGKTADPKAKGPGKDSPSGDEGKEKNDKKKGSKQTPPGGEGGRQDI